jgi:hypothetical protein
MRGRAPPLSRGPQARKGGYIDLSVGSTQPPETVTRKADDDVVHCVGKFVHDAVDESALQFARLAMTQLHAHEHQHAFDEDGLAGRPYMPDCLIGITLPARIVAGRVAGRFDRPKIDPRRLALVAERDSAECRKSPGVIDNERGTSGAHGRSSKFSADFEDGRAPGGE